MAFNIQITKIAKSRIAEVDFNHLPFGKIFTDHMFEADYIQGHWNNGRIRPIEKLSLHPANLTLHYGQSIFEGMKAGINRDGNPVLFRPEMHVKRINKSAWRMDMPSIPEEMFMEGLKQLLLLEKDWIPNQPGSALYIRPLMFATDEFIGVAPSMTYKFLILTLPVGPYYSQPVKLWIEEKYVRAVPGGTGEAKAAGNYAGSLLPATLAKKNGYDQVVWMDAFEFKYIQEVGTMNLFFVFKDKVVTPATDGAILRGITRDSFIHLLKQWNIPIEERPISVDEVFASFHSGELLEAFGAGTAAVATNIASITWRDQTIEFSSANWTLSSKLRNTINQLRDGSIPDPFGWTHPVLAEVPVL